MIKVSYLLQQNIPTNVHSHICHLLDQDKKTLVLQGEFLSVEREMEYQKIESSVCILNLTF